MAKRRKVRLDLGPSGKGRVFLDGEDISDTVRSVTVHAEVGKVTRVDIGLAVVDVEYEGVGYVDVTSIVDHDQVFTPLVYKGTA